MSANLGSIPPTGIALKPLKQLRRHLKWVAPTLEISGRAQHRRVEGQLTGSVEGNCFAKVFFIAESGIGTFEKQIRDVCRAVAYVQYDSRRGDYPVEMRVFGTDGDGLVKKIRVGEPPAIDRIRRRLIELVGDSPGTNNPVIKDVGRPEKGDLVLVLCRNRSVAVGEDAGKRLERLKPKHVVWVVLEDEGFTTGSVPPAYGTETGEE